MICAPQLATACRSFGVCIWPGMITFMSIMDNPLVKPSTARSPGLWKLLRMGNDYLQDSTIPLLLLVLAENKTIVYTWIECQVRFSTSLKYNVLLFSGSLHILRIPVEVVFGLWRSIHSGRQWYLSSKPREVLNKNAVNVKFQIYWCGWMDGYVQID